VEAAGVWDEAEAGHGAGEKRWSGLGLFGRGHRSEVGSPSSVKSGRSRNERSGMGGKVQSTGSESRWWSAGERQSEREALVGA
jgi:hypothetical protein